MTASMQADTGKYNKPPLGAGPGAWLSWRPSSGRVGLLGVLLCLALAACSAFTSEEPPVADSTLVEVLIELHVASVRAELQRDLPPGTRDSILARYHLDEAQFNAAMQYYAEHPDAYVELYNTVLDRLSAEAGSLP